MSQRDRIRSLFCCYPNEWIALPRILDMRISQYGRVIHELRRGFKNKKGDYLPGQEPLIIRNKTKRVNGETHSWFMYVPEDKDGQQDMYLGVNQQGG